MLNKKECKQALKDYTGAVMRSPNAMKFDDDKNKWILKSRYQRQHDMLENLIEDYFESQACKFEELEEGIPYYHGGLKKFCLLVSKQNKDTIVLSVCTEDGSSIVYVEYEENSFFPLTKIKQYREESNYVK